MRHRLVLLPVLVATLVGAPPALAWTWPADGPVLQPFVLGDDPYAAGQHRGIDVAGIAGAPVCAPAGGIVSFAGSVPGGGRTVTIQTADGYAVTLLHLGALGVARGVQVTEGATVGVVGSSGEAEHAVPSVHLGVRVASDPQGYLDPLLFLPARVPEASGEVVAPEPAVEAAPVPLESAEPGGPVANAGSEPGGLEGSAPVEPPGPAVVEAPVAPGAPVEVPAPAVVDVPAPVADAGGNPGGAATTPVAGDESTPRAHTVSAPQGRAVSPGPEAEVAESTDAPTRTAKPEPAVSSGAPDPVPTPDAPAIPLGLGAAAAVALLAAGAFGLRFRRAADEPPSAVDVTQAPEPSVVVMSRRRPRRPGGPGRRLERLGPHGDAVTQSERADAWR